MRAKGFSKEVARRIATSHWASTQKTYNSHWRTFCRWCRTRGRDPLAATPPVVADFLTYMFKEKDSAVSTLQGYRSVLLNTLKDQANADFRDNIFLRNLLSNFMVERPRSLRSLPQWDLGIVMRRLTRAPFEPLRATSMQALSWKTAFLLALA